MKADVVQQQSLLELMEIDAELSRLSHRASHLPEQQAYEAQQSAHQDANDRLAALAIALDDLEAQVTRFESEINGVRQREDRDRSLLDSGTTNPKQLAELQHELDTLERRQSSLEDSLLEVMERREELQTQQSGELTMIDTLHNELAGAQRLRDDALADIENTRIEKTARRDGIAAALDPDLIALYERQRASGGIGAGLFKGGRCGACRIELDRGELGRIAAAADDEVLRCPECNVILLRVKGSTA